MSSQKTGLFQPNHSARRGRLAQTVGVDRVLDVVDESGGAVEQSGRAGLVSPSLNSLGGRPPQRVIGDEETPWQLFGLALMRNEIRLGARQHAWYEPEVEQGGTNPRSGNAGDRRSKELRSKSTTARRTAWVRIY